MPGCVGFVVRAHCKRVPGRHRVTGLRSSSNDDNQATTQPALQVKTRCFTYLCSFHACAELCHNLIHNNCLTTCLFCTSADSNPSSSSSRTCNAPPHLDRTGGALLLAAAVAEQPAGEAHAQQPSISNHGMSIEIPFEEPDRMEKFWTRARLAFALPWRRFKKGSVLTIKGRQAASMMHEGECPS
eukprot:scaffold113341_cov20-Tisochrysis_lutea.AAC.2